MKKKDNKIVWFLVFVVLVGMTFYTIIKQSETFSVKGFLTYISTASWQWVVLAFVCMLAFIAFEGMALWILCRTFGYGQKFKRSVTYSALDIYFSAITPSATGGQPVTALFMMNDQIPGAVTTIILLVNLTLYTISIVIIGIVSFFARPEILPHFTHVSKVMIILGLIIQILLIVVFILLVCKETIVMSIANVVMKWLHKLRLLRDMEGKQKRLKEIEIQYKECASAISKHKKALVATFLCNLLQRISIIMVPVCLFLSKGGTWAKVMDVFATQGYVIVGSNCIPLPGAVGAADFLFMDGFSWLVDEPVNIELFSRGISFYCCIIVCGLISLVAYLSKGLKGLKQKKNDRIL